ncbi:MAG: SDR family oxidoreductase [Microthrixaceae bacterium]
MQVDGTVVVVTGGASGIGEALVRRFAAEGAAAVVAADLDAAGAERVAREVAAEHPDCRALARSLDAGSRDDVHDLVAEIRAELGPIDLFCANAGIGTGAGVDASDAQWEAIWRVNVMAHVHAAQALLPGWLERGSGYLLTTASAAGLLTNLGDAPYSVTKHAAVGLAEWLAITYGDRGVRVSCLCPQGVRTPLLFGSMAEGELAAEVVKAQGVIEPEDVADAVVEGLADERFLILPHPEVARFEQARAADRDRWLGSMRKLQARITGGG